MRIRTVDLTKTYHIGSSEITAVNKVSLEVNEPRFIAFIGPSGSGKSTLLNLIGLNDYPTHGSVYIDDSNVSSLSPGKRRKFRLSCMGFVFQTFNLLPVLNALENVELPMILIGKPEEEQKEKAVRLLDSVGLDKRLFHRPKELSMGEMQRVAIARALANDPRIIVADEPTGELDSTTAKEIIDLLLDIYKREKTTVLVATHDEKIVEKAHAIYMMQDGRLNLEEEH